MNKTRSMILILILNIVLISCNEREPSKTVVAVFDLSGSTNNEETMTNYANGLKTVLSGINYGDVIVVCGIMESSISHALTINEAIPPFTLSTDNQFLVKKEKAAADAKLSQIKEKILHTAQDLLLRKDLKRKVLKSDIFGSIYMADHAFHTYKNDKKVLIIFSDMVQEDGEYNFAKETLSDNRITEIIAREKTHGRLPELTGVLVNIVGTAAPTREKFFMLQNFWMKYFKESGTTLSKKDFGGATLINSGKTL